MPIAFYLNDNVRICWPDQLVAGFLCRLDIFFLVKKKKKEIVIFLPTIPISKSLICKDPPKSNSQKYRQCSQNVVYIWISFQLKIRFD